ncbi:phosphoenolpyruvate carboxykinase [Nisaea sediminum]|uniref:phosphoenolpyruvate carboxykinase n=1 Tax=Nisaea sediminum TaxID=2775867 RepID=UPI001868FB72|nr:phosphoenolpyruvate carboxykinase [Nisaea sediminum]
MGQERSAKDLEQHGLFNLGTAYWNLSVAELYEHAIRNDEGQIVPGGALAVETGKHTGRSPKDKFIVDTPSVHDQINWGDVNRPCTPELFDEMHRRLAGYMQNRDCYVLDCFAGADEDYRLPVRVVTETAWHNLFAKNMFRRPEAAELKGFEPQFTVLQAPGLQAAGEADGLNSETFILVNFDKRLVIVGGSWYAGEIKKSIFGILNHMLPDVGVMPMHCSANVSKDGESAIFFGLSGTGKTTLSSDGTRILLGDDEHGWSDKGIFNFEGGCYAKVIRLSEEAEPEIYAASQRFGTVLENVVYDQDTRQVDFDDGSLTENSRSCYPIDFIPNTDVGGTAGHPKHIMMLTADAFGVLPPISKLTPEQAMYHFLSGYTARVAGTEKGLGNDPQATFSTCFGAPFMPRHPSVYGEMLRERIAKHGATCWLVNTGWQGGRAGSGAKRMEIAFTRAMVRAALAGKLDKVPVKQEPHFGLFIPESCPGVPSEVLDPRNSWSDKEGYDATAADLRKRFQENFRQFEKYVEAAVIEAGVKAAA